MELFAGEVAIHRARDGSERPGPFGDSAVARDSGRRCVGRGAALTALRGRQPARRRVSDAVDQLDVFLALGWCDEIVFHRRRTMHRENLIHTTQHLAEGIMWTTLDATRVLFSV